jgi:four helix bundle protein
MIYDLEDRTKKFSIDLIKFLKTIKRDSDNDNIIFQLMKSGTSFGANYHEANGASSARDFFNKISICLKESKETKYWIESLVVTNPERKEELRVFWARTHEFVLIFGKITSSPKNKK